MVVKMMKWRPWPPVSTKKFEVKLIVNCLKGVQMVRSEEDGDDGVSRYGVEIRWKGSKGSGLSSLRRGVRRNFTREECLRDEEGVGGVEWNEEFQSVCDLSGYNINKDGAEASFNPWEVAFTIINGLKGEPSGKVRIIATGALNIADFASAAEDKDIEIRLPLQAPTPSNRSSPAHGDPTLQLSLRLSEVRNARDSSEIMPRRCISFPGSPEKLPAGKPEVSPLRAGLRKVKIFKGFSSKGLKKSFQEDEGSDGRNSVRSDDVEDNYPLDTNSSDDTDEGESEEGKEYSNFTNPFDYGTLAYANQAGESLYSYSSGSENEDLIHYNHKETDVGNLAVASSPTSVIDQSFQKSSKLRILPWKKRKLSFRSRKNKGEPLLKKHYGEEGGDDIDFDRRQFSSSDESSMGKKSSSVNQSCFSEFGDDNFAVGSWEQKEIVSRDGQLKMTTEVFFASMDQRSERAAGESACTALVSVIADWFQSNPKEMPIKSQLDSLIHEGSLEWRNLCDNETYRERFPDKHFDLDTVLQAKVRPLTIEPDRSFVGFFHPEGIEDGGFDFLQDAMSFDNIWEEISQSIKDHSSNEDSSMVYIVSWNDHFFVLKVEREAYYIIDTLGERLHEGCTQAFILKFDKDTTIQRLPDKNLQPDESTSGKNVEPNNKREADSDKASLGPIVSEVNEEEVTIDCKGKESCKEYIKNFLAAIPIRELQVDLKKGLMASVPLHHRLQIEFHYTKHFQQEQHEVVLSSPETMVADEPADVPPEA